MRALQRLDLVGRVRAERRRRRTRRRGGPRRSTPAGRSSRRWMGSMSSSSSTSSTTSIMIAPAPPTSSAGGAQLVAVGARGLEAVVAVGEHDRRARRSARGSSAMRAGSSIAPSSWMTPSTSMQVASIGVGLELRGEPGREAEAPDRVDVRPCRAQQREPIGLRLGRGALVGEHARVAGLGQRERADHAAGVARLAVRVRGTASGTSRSGARRRCTSTPDCSHAASASAARGRSGRRRRARRGGGATAPRCAGAAASSAARCSSSITS